MLGLRCLCLDSFYPPRTHTPYIGPAATIGSITSCPRASHHQPAMLTFLYYALMLLVGFVFTGTAKKCSGYQDQQRRPQGIMGSVGFWCWAL